MRLPRHLKETVQARLLLSFQLPIDFAELSRNSRCNLVDHLAGDADNSSVGIHSQLRDRLEARWGEPVESSPDILKWRIPCAPRMDIHVYLDSLSTPDLVTVWAFDPCADNDAEGAAQFFRVDGEDDIERVLEAIDAKVNASRVRCRTA